MREILTGELIYADKVQEIQGFTFCMLCAWAGKMELYS